MEFEVKFEKDAELYFQFSDGEMEAVDAAAEEAVPVLGQITADGEEIGQIILYELYNDELFYQKCDELVRATARRSRRRFAEKTGAYWRSIWEICAGASAFIFWIASQSPLPSAIAGSALPS